MNKKMLIGVGGAVLFIAAIVLFIKSIPPRELKAEKYKGMTATVYMTSTCGCCRNYAGYLKREGFDVKTEVVNNLTGVKEKYAIPQNLLSCHTTVLGDYVVEGHIPIEAIVKVLDEKPDIRGIAMAGMPAASPGMPGVKNGPFNIYQLTSDGSNELYISL